MAVNRVAATSPTSRVQWPDVPMTMFRFAQFFAGSVALFWVLDLLYERVNKLRSRWVHSSGRDGSRVPISNDRANPKFGD